MAVTESPIQKAPPDVARVHQADGLHAIRRPECPGVVWERPVNPVLQQWVDRLPPESLPGGRRVAAIPEVAAVVAELCAEAGTPEGIGRDLLIDDVGELAEQFAAVMGLDQIQVRLDVINTNACRKFHIDAITARLICTYRGSGTEYGFAVDGADPDSIQSVPTSSVIVLRGTRWPEQPCTGLKHRSPPIEGTGETRLVLVLDLPPGNIGAGS